ncbi:MAG: LysR substrate-binding domain-containing protein [Amphritea sp.]|nr:LysR substrate-binding domain-containing protein [Amphritea sp.]
MRLDIKHWQLLEAVSRYGNLGHAADAIGVTQSALSHRLAEAERRLGSTIFERDGRRLRVTPAGKILIQAAENLLPELAKAEAEFQQTAADACHLIRIGVAGYSAYHWVPGFLQSLPVSREKLQIDFVATTAQNSLTQLQSGAVDLLITPEKIDNQVLRSQPLIADELVLITHPEHPLAAKTYIEAEDLIGEEYLTYSSDVLPGFEYERFIRPSGVRPRHLQVVEMTDAIVEMIAVNLGVSILPRWALHRALNQGLVHGTPLTERGLPLTWYVASRRSDNRHQPVQLTRQALQDWFSQNPS